LAGFFILSRSPQFRAIQKSVPCRNRKRPFYKKIFLSAETTKPLVSKQIFPEKVLGLFMGKIPHLCRNVKAEF
jgi:hypothetical protein